MQRKYSASFLRGFGRGLSSPYETLYTKPPRYALYGRGHVALSWALVGGLLSAATAIEAEKVEQITEKKRTKSSSRIHA